MREPRVHPGAKQIKKTHEYEILKEYTIDEIKELGDVEFFFDEEVTDKKIKLRRANAFNQVGHDCVAEDCDIKGTHFALGVDNGGGIHLDLYGYEDGELILMTIDHIHPKSKGGRNHVSNYQAMCKICNEIKSDNI